MKSVYIPLEGWVERAKPVSLDDYGVIEEPESNIALAIDMRKDEMGTDPDELRPMLNMSGEPDFQHEREGTIAQLSSNEVLCERTQLYVPMNKECQCGETHGRVLPTLVFARGQNAVSNNHINIKTEEKMMGTMKTVYKVAKVGKYGDCAVTFQLENGVSEYTFISAKVVEELGIKENSILDIEYILGSGELERTWNNDGIATERKNPQRRLKIAGTVSVIGQAVGVVAGTTVNK